ncbi:MULTISPECIES: ATP-binding protein [Geobacter]|uniref:ATP-binding protein n=1 Tax=Geobacter TaxID=28231 RepID=UPI0025725F9F|nr:ATP-binding protein [Geobacter sulfurreducens]BEH10744.1 ATP-binding protein [Geobacter sulfurreducens subsp. ethanolicus]
MTSLPASGQHQTTDTGSDSRQGFVSSTERNRIRELEVQLTELLGENERLRAAQQELRAAAAAADAATTAKSELLAHASHEIRSQLQLISGAIDLFRQTRLDETQRHYLDGFQHANDLLLCLVNDILDTSLLEAGHLRLESLPFDLAGLVAATGTQLLWQAQRKGLELSWHVSPDVPPRILGDPARVQQVIVNLAGNAIKFTPEGTVTIRVERIPVPLTASSSAMIRFVIEDTGIGIPVDRLGGIFESYDQGSPETPKRFGGTGLGLAIAKGLIEAMDGDISVESSEGRGSRFIVTIPFCLTITGGRQASADGQEKASESAPPLRILVAEDAEDIRMLIAAFLRGASHQVRSAANGREALDMFMAEDFDLVLMDIQMPVMDGYTATRTLREWEREQGRAPVPVVALTACAEKSDSLKTIEAGCTSHLSKPIRKDTLLRTVAELARQ